MQTQKLSAARPGGSGGTPGKTVHPTNQLQELSQKMKRKERKKSL
jgi:hypothetical protein